MEFLAGRGDRERLDDAIGAWTLELREHRVLTAEGVEFLRGRLGALDRHDVGDDELTPPVVGNPDDKRIRHCGMAVEGLLDLYRMHVLAAGDEHVVLASDDRDELVDVPGGEIADVQPATVVLRLLLLR